MIALVRNGVALVLACVLTWLLLFHAPLVHATGGASGEPAPGTDQTMDAGRPAMDLLPIVEEIVAAASSTPQTEVVEEPVESEAEPEPEPELEADREPAPPPAEAGSRRGEDDGTLAAEAPEPDAEEKGQAAAEAAPKADADAPRSVAELTSDSELLEVAREELSGRAAVGFATVFVSRPEDQLAIARAFGEDVVLVPRDALDPDDATAVSYRLNLDARARVETIPGRPPLEQYRQYRDLFAYDFARLPEAMRTLRKSVVRRDRVFLFAALVPPAEWAVVVGRRRAALEALRLDEQDVERFVMRYVRRGADAFDIRVDEIVLADGTRHRPAP